MKRIKQTLWLSLPVLVVLTTAFISSQPGDIQAKVCRPQMGQVVITVPPGETSKTEATQASFCPGFNLQVTGGTSNHLPIILNAGMHQGYLLITASVLKPEDGPVDVTVWWRLDTAY